MRLAPPKQAIEQHCGDADANGAIGKVKGWPVPGSDMEIEKIDHSAKANPIDNIADRAADYQPDRDGEERTDDAAQPKEQHHDNGRGHHG
jgi:hypothetical protein